jgi:CBS domain containing-hemolysin-like protein
MTLSAIGAKALNEVSWHELKEYCKRRQGRERFDHIHDHCEQVTFGLECLRVVGAVLLVVGVAAWFANGTLQESIGGREMMTAALVLGSALLVTTVWLPGALAAVFGDGVLYHLWRILHLTSTLVWPLTIGVSLMETVFRRASGRKEEDEEEAFEDEVLAIVTEGLHDGLLEADAREMIEGVIELGDEDVADIMTPLSEINAFPIDMPWNDVLIFATECGRTRIPAYQDSIDNVVGVLYVKDMLRELAKEDPASRQSIQQLLRKPWSVPTTMPLDELLSEFLKTRSHLAIVRDEYMGIAGLVTIEDVLEEIVGEIVDESDKEAIGEINRVDERTVVIHGRAHLAEINEELGYDLPEPEGFDTIAGFVVSQMGRIPAAGETLLWSTLRITVLEATKRKIDRVQVETIEASA